LASPSWRSIAERRNERSVVSAVESAINDDIHARHTQSSLPGRFANLVNSLRFEPEFRLVTTEEERSALLANLTSIDLSSPDAGEQFDDLVEQMDWAFQRRSELLDQRSLLAELAHYMAWAQQELLESKASDAAKARFNATYEKVSRLYEAAREYAWPLNVTTAAIDRAYGQLQRATGVLHYVTVHLQRGPDGKFRQEDIELAAKMGITVNLSEIPIETQQIIASAERSEGTGETLWDGFPDEESSEDESSDHDL
jgi:hypothetical protein